PHLHPLSLHDALPISWARLPAASCRSVGVESNRITACARHQIHLGVLAFRAAVDTIASLHTVESNPFVVRRIGWIVLGVRWVRRSEEHTSELQSLRHL